MTQPRTASPPAERSLRAPVLWGIVWVAAAILVVLIAVGVDFHH